MSIATAAPSSPRADAGAGGARLPRGARWMVGAIVLLLALVVLAFATRSDLDTVPMSTHNATPTGTRALAQVARAQGVDVRQISRLSSARILSPETTTLVLTSASQLSDAQARSVLDYPGPIVLIGESLSLTAAIDPGMAVGQGEPGTRAASCAQPDASAARAIASDGPIVTGAPSSLTDCFPAADGATMIAQYRLHGAPVVVLADPGIVTNAGIEREGNAALALRLVGGTEHAVWYVGSPDDASTLTWIDTDHPAQHRPSAEPQTTADIFPPGTGYVVYALALALGFVAWWRGRRFGPLVREPLPVVIRAIEATRGRARLYRSAGASARAVASLRASAAVRMGARLGVPRTSTPEALVGAIARASGRDATEVTQLLYGPAPANEKAMMRLVELIDMLESEVHRS